MAGTGEILTEVGLPSVQEAHNLSERFLYAAPRQVSNASIRTCANVIAGKKLKKATLENLKAAIVGTYGVACASQIGDAYGKELIDPITHKVLHAALGATEGAILDGKKGAVAGGASAFIAETVADIIAPKIPSLDKIQSIEERLGRLLTQEEFHYSWNTRLKNYLKSAASAADISKLVAASVALLADQDMDIAQTVSSTSIDNNFLGQILMGGSMAWSAYNVYNAYQEKGFPAACEQIGIEISWAAGGFLAGKAIYKVGGIVYPTARAAVDAALKANPALKNALGKFADTMVIAGEKLQQSVIGKKITAINNYPNKIKNKFANLARPYYRESASKSI